MTSEFARSVKEFIVMEQAGLDFLEIGDGARETLLEPGGEADILFDLMKSEFGSHWNFPFKEGEA